MNVRILKGVSAVVGAAALIAACTGTPAGSPGSSTAAGAAARNRASRHLAGGQPGRAEGTCLR